MATTTHKAHRVYLAEHWADEWELQDRVYCEGFTEVAGPDVAEATLSFVYGFVQPSETVTYSQRAAKNINGWWVKVELDQDEEEETVRTWYGIVVSTDNNRFGLTTSRGMTADSGEQTFHCRGLEFALMRKTLTSSFAFDSGGEEIEIGRAIGFNLGQGRDNNNQRHGNKSSDIGENDAYIFAFDVGIGGVSEEAATQWSVQDIIVYLLHYHPPKNVLSNDVLNWQSPDGGDAKILEKLFPIVQADGKSVKQILDEIIDRRRLVGYTIIVQGDDETPKIDVFTFNKTTFDMTGEATIPANSNQQTWYFDDDANIEVAIISADDATRHDVVVARGAPLTSVFTIANNASATDYEWMNKDWNDDSVDTYNDGASTGGSYSGLVSIDKQAANQAFRADTQFEKVFRAFMLDPEFDGQQPNATVICPDPTQEGEDESPSGLSTTFWYPGLRFLDTLTLRTDFDYTTVEDFETTSKTSDNSQPDYLRPFAVTVIGSGSLYYRMDRPGQGKMTAELLKNDGLNWAASLRMQDDCPGLFIDVHGAPQHVIASAEFSPVDDDDEYDDQPVIDWKKILCTICCEFDQHVEARYPSGELDTETDFVRELVIEAPQYRLDYLTPGTVVGVDDEGALITTDGGYIRDDRAYLQDIARRAYEWYGTARKALRITQRNLLCDHSVGELITNIGSAESPVEVNSVITKIAFDIRNNTVTVFTQYAELDFTR
jgi:hypothetical protein